MTWEEIGNAIVNFFSTSGVTLLKAIGLWIVGYLVIKVAMLVLSKIFGKAKMEKVTQGFLLSVIKFILYMILLVMILSQLGVEVTGLIAALAALGLAIGLALQDSLSNVASGVILLMTHPFKEGDLVNVNGVEGRVKNIKILTTALLATDNKLIVLPNSTVAKNAIINYSNRKVRRVDFTFKVDYQTDTQLVKKIVFDVMQSNGKVRLQQTPFCSLKSLGEQGLEFFAYCWVASDDYWSVYYYVVDNVFNEFKRHKIKIAFNRLEVRLKEEERALPYRSEPLPERVESKEKENKEENEFLKLFKKFDLINAGKKARQKKQDTKKSKAKPTKKSNTNKAEQSLENKKQEIIKTDKADTSDKKDKADTSDKQGKKEVSDKQGKADTSDKKGKK